MKLEIEEVSNGAILTLRNLSPTEGEPSMGLVVEELDGEHGELYYQRKLLYSILELLVGYPNRKATHIEIKVVDCDGNELEE